MAEDVLLLHPPSFYDPAISLPRFPGPIAQTVADSTPQFIVYPIGLLSIAEFLVRHGFKAKVDNIGERFVADPQFDLDKHIGELGAKVYGVDLHWCVHIPGALTLAKLVKRAHPEAFVVLGGLTSTFYSTEILSEHSYVDGVLGGEAEEPMVDLLEVIENHRQFETVPNLSYREGSTIRSNQVMTPVADLDSYDFTRLDLVEPRKAGVFKRSSIPICRGCVFNCATCGGSQYSYSKLFKREKPAFRSPEKIAEDLMKLKEQGVRVAFLFQDGQMGGKNYCERLVEAIKKPADEFDVIALEFFSIPPAEYLEQLSKLSSKTTFTISPESWTNQARARQGRNYSDTQLLKLSESCKKLGLRLTAFFMSGIAGPDGDSDEDAVLWDELSSLGTRVALGSMILMDPGSLAFDDPSRFGYEHKATTLGDHVKALNLPSWHQWLNYSIVGVSSDELAEMLLDHVEEMLSLRQRKKLIPIGEYQMQKFQIEMYRIQIKEVEKIFKMKEQSRSDRLWTLAYACSPNQDLTERDPYGYNAMILDAARKVYEGDTIGDRNGRGN